MAKDALFRNSLIGYNKNDVNRYIEDLGVQYTDRGDELEGEIKELRKQLEELPALRAEKEKAERLTVEVEALRKENEDIAEAIRVQGDTLESTRIELSDVSAEKNALELRVKELMERDEKLTAENARIAAEAEIKAKELKELSDEAVSMKERLLEEQAEFEKRAEEMLMQIQAQAKEVIDKANETADSIIEDARRKVQSEKFVSSAASSPRKKDSLSDMLESHKSRMDSFFSAITKNLRGDK